MERNLTLIALFAALIAGLALMPKLELIAGVPITLQSLGIMLAGTVLGARAGFLAVILYLVLGAIGLPIFAGGAGGLGPFFGPTGGFLIGFAFAALATGLVMAKVRGPVGLTAFLAAAIGGIVVLYAIGVPFLAYVIDKPVLDTALLMAPFLPGDLIKAVVAALITRALYQMRPGVVLSRA